MEWIKDKKSISGMARVAIKSWCLEPEPDALKQAGNLAAHPAVEQHVALMPDCHVGYGMPIGGVIGCRDAVIPNAVGVDIGCGMGAVRTSARGSELRDREHVRAILDAVKRRVPVGEGNSHRHQVEWAGFEQFEKGINGKPPDWFGRDGIRHDGMNLGTLGGGNHFIELQTAEDGTIWLMLHSGSRNLGYRIANFYHKLAQKLNAKWHVALPCPDLAFLPTDSPEGQAYIRDMNFALAYAFENRTRMMQAFRGVVGEFLPGITFPEEINIHHNYAALETHFGRDLWIHRKGATSAQKDQMGIIPGSMGASSYIVRGLGNPESFTSCSHGAGRRMGRMEAGRRLTLEECNHAMEGIVFDRWHSAKSGFGRKKGKGSGYDFGEAPQAYKDIDQVMASQGDLVEPVVKLRPLGVVKG